MLLLTLILAANLGRSRVDVYPSIVLREFEPAKYFGGCIDGGLKGSVLPLFRPQNLKAMASTGVKSIAYRLRTELGCEAWHWNPEGTWSDPRNQQGYWTGSAVPSKSINLTWGYALPRRGNTYDQANNDSYSRIDDGDLTTFWKSNPYLDPAYSGDDKVTPQWVVIDLHHKAAVNGIRIRWANPFAVRFRVEYWAGEEDLNDDDKPDGSWKTFPHGTRRESKGGDEVIELGKIQPVRFVRIILLDSSHTSDPSNSSDRRDKMGFAIREIELGNLKNGNLEDEVVHEKDKDQTAIFTSSTDPWHRSTDIDRNTEQPGFDLFLRSRLTHSQPALMPVSALYGTPDDAVAELQWLLARGYAARGFEIGEEPDGQCIDPEQYTSIYVQIADRLKSLSPKLMIGGPCLQRTLADYSRFPNHHLTSWMTRFVQSLSDRQKLGSLNFASFEWYPFEKPFGDYASDLKTSSILLEKAMAKLNSSTLLKNIPWCITEFGYAALAGPKEVDIQDAVINADIAARFLLLGGQSAFQYGFEPGSLDSDFDDQWET